MRNRRISLTNRGPTGVGAFAGGLLGVAIVVGCQMFSSPDATSPFWNFDVWVFLTIPASVLGVVTGIALVRVYHRIYGRHQQDEWLREEKRDLLQELDCSAAYYAFFALHAIVDDKRPLGTLALLTDQHLILAEMQQVVGHLACDATFDIGQLDCQGLLANYILHPAHSVLVIPWPRVRSIFYRGNFIYIRFVDEGISKERSVAIDCSEENRLYRWDIATFIIAVGDSSGGKLHSFHRPYKQPHRFLVRSLCVMVVAVFVVLANVVDRDASTWFNSTRLEALIFILLAIAFIAFVDSFRKPVELIIYEDSTTLPQDKANASPTST